MVDNYRGTWRSEEVRGLFLPVEREDIKKECRKVNMMEILCTHIWKWRNETYWNYSRNGGKGIKENDGVDEFT
jgi:hypothetical protein